MENENRVSMDVRLTEKDYKKLKGYKLPDGVVITKDDSIETSVIMVHMDGEFKPWHLGYDRIESYLRLGYARIAKWCPMIKGKCKAEKCSKYLIQNGTGDCVDVWNFYKK